MLTFNTFDHKTVKTKIKQGSHNSEIKRPPISPHVRRLVKTLSILGIKLSSFHWEEMGYCGMAPGGRVEQGEGGAHANATSTVMFNPCNRVTL